MDERSNLRRIASGFAALIGLVLLVAGMPAALWTLAGWPLPAGLPGWSEVQDTLTSSRLPDATLVKLVAVVGWVAWTQVVASAAVETVAWARGRPARQLAASGTIQAGVRRMVATSALLFSTLTANLPSASAAPGPVAAVSMVVDAPPVLANSIEADGAVVARADTALVYTVQRRDTLWALAETHLGDPFRWRELFELNEHRLQVDGARLTDPYLMQTGWTLVFPRDAVGLQATEPTAPVEVGAEPAAPSSTPLPSSASPGVPACDAAPSTVATPQATTSPSNSATTRPETSAHAGAAPAIAPAATDAAPDRVRVPLPAVGGGLLAASLLAVLTRLRRVQQRRRATGARVHQPRPDLAPVETAIRIAAAPDDARLLDLGLRAFLAAISPTDESEAPAVIAVRLHDHLLEVLLDHPIALAPEGFDDIGDGRAWRTARNLTADRLEHLAADAPAPLPSLVTVGVADGGELLVDLETCGLLLLHGDPETAASLLRRLATELATSTWADHLDVITTDPRLGDLTGTQRIRRLDLDTALDELAAAGRLVSGALDAAQCTTTLQARGSGFGTADWTPTVLLHGGPLTAEQTERLRQVAEAGGRGVAAVVVGEAMDAPWSVILDQGVGLIHPLGITIEPHLLTPETAEAIDELLTDAAVDDLGSDADEPLDVLVETVTAVEPYPAPQVRFAEPAFDVEVRLLGDVEIVGATFDRRRVVELIAYLVLHPGGVTDERLKTALWPERVPSTSTFNSTVSQARLGLGKRDGDILRFPHFAATGNLYRLDPAVTCDALRFELRVQHARRCEPTEAIDVLHGALELVRGIPFSAPSGFQWAYVECLASHYEAMIGDAAHRLAGLCLDAGDPDQATWAAAQGLKASPGNEVLYRDRMLACHLNGNLAGVKSTFRELCDVVEVNEPYDSLHPETIALYDRLVHSRRMPA